MKILVIGGGGREHALVDTLDRSPLLTHLFVAPGNPGMEEYASCVDLDITHHDTIINFAKKEAIDLVVIGPEDPLVRGLADDLAAAGIAAFGPSAEAARLEGSKSFARDFCARHNIPQPAFAAFDNKDAAIAHIKTQYAGRGCVIKANGLAAGKGVIVADTESDAINAVNTMLCENAFGGAGSSIVIEDRIHGIEASLFAMVDKTDAVFIGSAQDYKRALDGDKGDNTGGMGAISPAPALSDSLCDEAWQKIVLPVVNGMAEEGCPYRGFLYCGLMLTDTGPQVIEFNCRFGDPEAQTILPRLRTDLLAAMMAAVKGGLKHTTTRFDDRHAVTVIMTNGGYPANYQKGAVINGLNDSDSDSDSDGADVMVFHAGTSRDADGAIIATGGRVLAITALGETAEDARIRAYQKAATITWQDCFYRRDIGTD